MAFGTETLDPAFRPWAEYLLAVLVNAGWAPVVTSARRSYAQQARLYRRYLAGLSRYPALPPGSSLHELGLAVDLGGLTDDQLAAAGAFWKGLGGSWGASDPIHFEV